MSTRTLTLSFLTLMAAGSVALFMVLGTPGLLSMPLAERLATSGQKDNDLAVLVERLVMRMEANPYDSRGWLLLGLSYGRLQRFTDSAEAYRRAIASGSREVETFAAYGEALVGAAQGVVSPEARSAFETALADDPGNRRARYYLGLSAAQAGDLRGAYETWRKLAADTPSDAPWYALLEAQLEQVAADLGIKVGESLNAARDEETNPPPK
jgi:cytochrome c-type biogenesis protein CcmH